MSIINDWYGTVRARPGITVHALVTEIRGVIGTHLQQAYFPAYRVITKELSTSPTQTSIRFGSIPNDGADHGTIECVMVAIAPLVEPGQFVQVLAGGLLTEATIYRFIKRRVKKIPAILAPALNKQWIPVTSSAKETR